MNCLVSSAEFSSRREFASGRLPNEIGKSEPTKQALRHLLLYYETKPPWAEPTKSPNTQRGQPSSEPPSVWGPSRPTSQ
eukprot:7988063-Pyramimonas_sp.AAC.1